MNDKNGGVMVEDGDTIDASFAPFSFGRLSNKAQSDTFEHSVKEIELIDILNFISKPERYCTEQIDGNKKVITLNNDIYANRFEELHTNDEFMLMPYEKNLFEKIVWPLKNAKLLYMLNSHIGTIALCGLICEMITLLIFEINLIKNDDTEITGKMISFQNKRQSDRIIELRKNIISEEILDNLDFVRDIRNRYIHEFCIEYTNIKKDAKEVYMRTHKVLYTFLKPVYDKKTLEFSKDFIFYLEKKGCIQKK